MVISPTIRKRAGQAAVWLLSPIWFPGMAVLFAILWTGERYDRRFGAKVGAWQPWFAWRPVSIGECGDETVWLERVERTRIGNADLYRRPGDPDIANPWSLPTPSPVDGEAP